MSTSEQREHIQIASELSEHVTVVEPTAHSPRDNQPIPKGATPSSQSTNSDVPSEHIAKTLSRVDENMYVQYGGMDRLHNRQNF